MQLDGDDHQVRGPAVHVAQQFAERNVVLQVKHIAESLHLAGVVVKHQQHAGEGEHQEQIKSDSAHSPRIAVAHRVTIDLRGMQMQKNVGEHAQRAIARRVVVLVAENRGVDLRLGRILKDFDLLFGFRRKIGLEGFEIFLDAGFDGSTRPTDLPFEFFSSGISFAPVSSARPCLDFFATSPLVRSHSPAKKIQGR